MADIPRVKPMGEDLMTDEDFLKTIEGMNPNPEEGEIGELLKMMNENRIISWEEAERILQDTDTRPVKCSLAEQSRPMEPDNDTDVDRCIQRLLDNDPNLKDVNLNNMKRTPVPQIRRLIEALAYNEHCERLSLANMGLYEHDVLVLITVIEMNKALKKLNLETNYLSGDFFSKLFQAALVNETLEEIKAVNQGVSFSTVSEKEIIDSVVKNKGLTKVSVNLRLPEGRHKIENTTLRNGEYKRVLRREAAMRARLEAEELEKNPVPKLAKEVKKEPTKVAPMILAGPPVEKPAPQDAVSKACQLKEPLKPKEPSKNGAPKQTIGKLDISKFKEPIEEKPVPRITGKVASLARRMSKTDTDTATPVINLGTPNAVVNQSTLKSIRKPVAEKKEAVREKKESDLVKKLIQKTEEKAAPKKMEEKVTPKKTVKSVEDDTTTTMYPLRRVSATTNVPKNEQNGLERAVKEPEQPTTEVVPQTEMTPKKETQTIQMQPKIIDTTGDKPKKIIRKVVKRRKKPEENGEVTNVANTVNVANAMNVEN